MSTNEDGFEYSPRTGPRPRTTGPDLMSMGCILPPIPSTKIAKSSYYYHDTPDQTLFDCFSYYVEGRHANNNGTSQEVVEELFAKLNEQDQKPSSEYADTMRKTLAAVDEQDAARGRERAGKVGKGEYGHNPGPKHDYVSKVEKIPSLHRKDKK